MTPKAGTWVEVEKLRRAVKDAGFKPGEVRCTVTGTLTKWEEQPALRLGGSDRILVLQPEPGKPQPYERAQRAVSASLGKAIEVEGSWVDRALPADRTSPAGLRVQRLRVSD